MMAPVSATKVLPYKSTIHVCTMHEAIDLAITRIKDRFDQPGFHMYRNFETVLVNAANKSNILKS